MLSTSVLLTMSADTALHFSSPRCGLSSAILRRISIGLRVCKCRGRGILVSWYSVVSPPCTFAWTFLMILSNSSYVVCSIDSWSIHVNAGCVWCMIGLGWSSRAVVSGLVGVANVVRLLGSVRVAGGVCLCVFVGWSGMFCCCAWLLLVRGRTGCISSSSSEAGGSGGRGGAGGGR